MDTSLPPNPNDAPTGRFSHFGALPALDLTPEIE